MRELAERAYFHLCGALGRLLRAGRYSSTRVVHRDGECRVRKRRLRHAPLLVWLGGPLVRMLDTGVRVLPQRAWAERERLLYRSLRGTAVEIDGRRTLDLPCLHGETLAALLRRPELGTARRERAIELAVAALARFHRAGFTHGDAMAENVMVELEAGVAHWFDFETVHEAHRPMAWRRADDLRALLATCLLRIPAGDLARTLRLVLDVYADEDVSRLLATGFASVLRRPLAFHLGQAPLSLWHYREVARLLGERGGARERRSGSRRSGSRRSGSRGSGSRGGETAHRRGA